MYLLVSYRKQTRSKTNKFFSHDDITNKLTHAVWICLFTHRPILLTYTSIRPFVIPIHHIPAIYNLNTDGSEYKKKKITKTILLFRYRSKLRYRMEKNSSRETNPNNKSMPEIAESQTSMLWEFSYLNDETSEWQLKKKKNKVEATVAPESPPLFLIIRILFSIFKSSVR